jgi:hypothetical protein
MATEVLNLYVNYPGEWNPAQQRVVQHELPRQIAPTRAVRLHSTAVSGGVTLLNLTPGGQPLTGYGIPEVFVKITNSQNVYSYLSAPLTTAVEFPDVAELSLGVAAIVGNTACTAVRYEVLINAHLIYELI